VSASDANSIGEMVGNARSYDAATLAHISQYNAHSYFGTDADRRAMVELARSHGKRLWQSESGPLSWPGGNQFDVAMWSADLILRDLRVMQAEAWLDWQVAGGGVWGVIDYTRSNQTSRMNKKGFAYAQFTRFVRPGARILASDHAATLAALVPASGSLVLMVVNTGSAAASYAFDLSRFPTLPQTAEAWRTSASEDVAALSPLPVSGKSVVVSAPSRSVTTLVLRGATAPTLVRSQPRGTGLRAAPVGFLRPPTPWFRPLHGALPANALGRRP
jgi:O-glycosyl hydrolase